MTENLEIQLFKKYPKILKDYMGDISKTGLHFGFQHDDGWFSILDKSMEKLQYFCDLCSKNGRDVQVVASTIKEKFGSLRFYVEIYNANDVESSIIDNIVTETENSSTNTCEITGKHGYLCNKGSWLKTLCYEQARISRYVACDENVEKYWKSLDNKNEQ